MSSNSLVPNRMNIQAIAAKNIINYYKNESLVEFKRKDMWSDAPIQHWKKKRAGLKYFYSKIFRVLHCFDVALVILSFSKRWFDRFIVSEETLRETRKHIGVSVK